MTFPSVLCIGGLDPSGRAGILADAEAARAAGGRALCVATAITVQTRLGVRGFTTLSPRLVAAQVEALIEDEQPAAVKLGMLAAPALAASLARILAGLSVPIVVDPVLAASGGEPLFSGPPSGYGPLLALAPVLTPNLPEAIALAGAGCAPAPEALAKRLVALGASAVILKGGHLGGPTSPDLVLDGTVVHRLRGRRLPVRARGTGCRFASSLATRLAAGDTLLAAARFAKAAVRRYLVSARNGG